MKKYVLALILSASLAAAASAQTFSCDVGGLAIPDDGYDGSVGSMACCMVDADLGFDTNILDVDVEYLITHTWVGDLVLKVVSPDGAATISTMMSRPGFAELADDGADCCGNSANWAGDPILFDDDGPDPTAETMGEGLVTDDFICLDDGICGHTPDAGSGGAPGGTLDIFDGLNHRGAWMCCAGDSAGADTGTLDDCRLTFKTEDSYPTLVDQPSDHLNAFASDVDFPQSVAGNFVLPAPDTIARVTAWGVYAFSNTAPADDRFTVEILPDFAGLPGAAPIYSSGSIVPSSRTMTPLPIVGFTEYRYVFYLPMAPSLNPGTYWISIFNDTTVIDPDDDWNWATAVIDPEVGIPDSVFAFEVPGMNWTPNGGSELALRVDGEAIFADGFESGDTTAWSTTVP
jgi:subtilisin-like proprotein convertase family protein